MNIATTCVLVLTMLIPGFSGLAQNAVTFTRKIIDPEPPDNVWIKSTGDFNADGHVDLLIGGHNGKTRDFIIWYQNPGTTKGNWIKHIVYEGGEAFGFEGGATGDLDGDGDVDLVLGSYWQHKLFWLENPEAGTGQWKLHELGAPKSGTTYLYDFDSDGKLDIVTRASQKYSGDVGRDIWIWKQNTLTSWTQYSKLIGDGEFFNMGDVDMDGKTDVVFANRWLRNNGNIDIGTWEEFTFTEAYTWLCTFPIVIDINEDGRNDIVLTPTVWAGEYAKTAWYEAPERQTADQWIEHIIEDSIECVTHALGIYDFDRNGSLDVFTAEMEQSDDPDEVRIYFNQGNGTSWTKNILSQKGSHWNQFADFDGDGDVDIFGANHGSKGPPTVELWENKTNPPIPLDNFHLILIDNKREQPRNFGVAAGDLTKDGMSDIVAGRYFYRNPGGDMSAPWNRTVFPGKPSIDAMLIVDVDDDAYGDVIAEDLPDVYWLEADDIQGASWTIRAKIGEIPSGPHNTSAQGYTAAQIIPGGKPEILLSSRGVYYFEIPPDPEQGNWPRQRIIESPNSEEGIGAGDMDNDGDIDVCGSINSDAEPNAVGWYENPGDGSKDWQYHQVSTVGKWADRFYMADLNRDGRMDIVISTANGTEDGVYWFEAPANPRDSNWKKHTVMVQDLSNSMDVADMDSDGDTGLIVGQHYTNKMMTPRKLHIFENDGAGNFTQHLIHTGVESHLGARVFNLDGDGDLDIVNIGWADWQYLYIWRNDGVSQ